MGLVLVFLPINKKAQTNQKDGERALFAILKKQKCNRVSTKIKPCGVGMGFQTLQNQYGQLEEINELEKSYRFDSASSHDKIQISEADEKKSDENEIGDFMDEKIEHK